MLATGSPAAADVDARALGTYLRARVADAAGDSAAAARDYAAVLDVAPDNPLAALRGYREAMEAGDVALVRRALAVLKRRGEVPVDGALFAFADALNARDRIGMDAALDTLSGGALAFLTPMLRAWLAFDAGQDPQKQLDLAPRRGMGARYLAEQRGLLLIAQDKAAEGAAALGLAGIADERDRGLRLAAAQFLAAAGEREMALAQLPGSDQFAVRERARLGQGVRPTAPIAISRLLTRIVADLGTEPPASLSISLARTALLLEPGNHQARLWLADLLGEARAPGRALRELEAIPADSGFAGAAAEQRVRWLGLSGDSTGAIAAATALANAPGAGPLEAQRLGDRLIDARRYDDAAAAFRLALTRAGDRAGWGLYLLLGTALDLAGRWAEARPMLERAVALAPDQPAALNALGYGLTERRIDPKRARALLERAAQLRPDDGAIADSLGWAHYRDGDLARALPLLEKAAIAEPGNSVINEHLGDAYWRLGRRYDARYAWAAAAVYAEEDAARRIAAKIAGAPPVAQR